MELISPSKNTPVKLKFQNQPGPDLTQKTLDSFRQQSIRASRVVKLEEPDSS